MKNVFQWYDDNDIVINTQKSKLMLIGSNRKLQKGNFELNIFYEEKHLHVKTIRHSCRQLSIMDSTYNKMCIYTIYVHCR